MNIVENSPKFKLNGNVDNDLQPTHLGAVFSMQTPREHFDQDNEEAPMTIPALSGQ